MFKHLLIVQRLEFCENSSMIIKSISQGEIVKCILLSPTVTLGIVVLTLFRVFIMKKTYTVLQFCIYVNCTDHI